MSVTAPPRETIRLDKWLWQARFFKSRSLAAAAVTGGGCRINGDPTAKPARSVGAGDVLTFAQADAVRAVRVLACGIRRGPAPEARTLYDDLAPPQEQRLADRAAPTPGAGEGRPSSRDRRARAALDARSGPDAPASPRDRNDP